MTSDPQVTSGLKDPENQSAFKTSLSSFDRFICFKAKASVILIVTSQL